MERTKAPGELKAPGKQFWQSVLKEAELEAAQTEKVISPIGEKIEIPESQLRPLRHPPPCQSRERLLARNRVGSHSQVIFPV
jgi:hypothetical protein